MRCLLVALGAPLLLLATGCWNTSTHGTYCQSGPKYGTQCYVSTPPSTSPPVDLPPPGAN